MAAETAVIIKEKMPHFDESTASALLSIELYSVRSTELALCVEALLDYIRGDLGSKPMLTTTIKQDKSGVYCATVVTGGLLGDDVRNMLGSTERLLTT